MREVYVRNGNAENNYCEEPQEEIALGGTPAGKATNEMRALARTARSFLMYDTKNEAIKGFLEVYQAEVQKVFDAFGEMELEIRPFEMLRGGEVVYLERDRERSLAFRLFRDGVRKITIQPTVAWEELLRLLEIMSIRYTGINQQEEDIVTLLLKSGFAHIQISAVEGFVPDDEEYCADDISAAAGERFALNEGPSHVEVPRDWDLPPTVLAPKELQFNPIDEEILALQQEGTSAALASILLFSYRRCYERLSTLSIRPPQDVSGLLSEARDFLLSEGPFAPLLIFCVHESILRDAPNQAKEVFDSFISVAAVRKI